MTTKVIGLRRLAFGVAAAAVTAAVALPVFAGSASALALQDRYVKLDTSDGGATGQFELSFELSTAHANLEGVAVDFCSNTPIIGDTCTQPTGLLVAASPTATPVAGATGVWTADDANSGRTLLLTKAAGDNLSANTVVTFTITNLTNPTADNTSFYARIFTFTTDTDAATWAALSGGDGSGTTLYTDSGGIALSTAAQITVTAKVQESLSFCVYTGANCGAGGTAVTLGDTNGVLRTNGSFVDKNTKYDLSTNAANGAIIRFKAGLPTSGGNTLATIGTTGTVVDALTSTTQFGLCSYRSAGSLLTVDTVYDGASGAPAAECSGTTQTAGTGSTGGDNSAEFAFDTAAAAATYGDTLATMAAGDTNTGRIAYVGNVSTTQPAGVYTNTFTFIATGTY